MFYKLLKIRRSWKKFKLKIAENKKSQKIIAEINEAICHEKSFEEQEENYQRENKLNS